MKRYQTLVSELESQIYQYKEQQVYRSTLENTITFDRDFTVKSVKGTLNRPALARQVTKFTAAKNSTYDIVLLKTADIGSTRLIVDTSQQKNLKKGMILVIGQGKQMEAKRLIGFGSLIIDQGLSYRQMKGSVLTAYPPTSKNVIQIQKKIIHSFVESLIVDDILESVVHFSSNQNISQQLNKEFSKRPTWRHSYNIQMLDKICLHSKISIFDISKSKSITGITDNGSYSTINLGWKAIDIVLTFLVIQILNCNEKYLIPDYILREYIQNDVTLSARFKVISDHRKFKSIEEMIDNYSSQGYLKWHSYLSLFQSFKVSSSSNLYDPEHTLGHGELSDTDILLMIYKVIDVDDDDIITIHDVIVAFAELDGVSTETSIFQNVLVQVTGQHSNETTISSNQFVEIRYLYSKCMKLVASGVIIHQVITIVGGSRNFFIRRGIKEYFGSKFSTDQVIPFIQSYVKSASVDMVSIDNLIDLLSSIKAPVSLCDLIRTTNSKMSFVGSIASVTNSYDLSQTAITQLAMSPHDDSAYAIDTTGICHVVALRRNEVIFCRRIIWYEPPISRSIEGKEVFRQWLETNNIMDSRSEISPFNNLLDSSVRIMAIMCAMPTDISRNIICVDERTGLILVNNSLSSHSVCVHEPVTFQRLYRFRVRCRLSKLLEESIRMTSNDLKAVPSFSQETCIGVLEQMVVNSQRSMLFCRFTGLNIISVFNYISGDYITDLHGHSLPISCMSYSHSMELLFSGSFDGSIRVWNDQRISQLLMEFNPNHEKYIGPLEDNLVNMNNTVTTAESKSLLLVKKYCSYIARILNCQPKWRIAELTGFRDSNNNFITESNRGDILAYEVKFPDSTVQLITNRRFLRNVTEVTENPNGPPSWRKPEAQTIIGENIALFEYDPYVFIEAFCRKFHLSPTSRLSHEQIASFITYFEKYDEGINIPMKLLLNALSVNEFDTISLSSFVRRLVAPSDKCLQVAERLLIGSKSKICLIRFLQSSKLIVSVSEDGTCSVWDPCLEPVTLSYINSGNVFDPKLIGKYPFSRIAGFSISNAESNQVLGACVSEFIDRNAESFPIIDHSLVAKCISIDNQFQSKAVRGFIYVFSDMSIVTIPNSFFLSYVTLQDIGELAIPSFTNSREVNHDICRVFDRRCDILRIVYFASNIHASLDDATNDFVHFGVISRGNTQIPSEQAQVVCFERPTDWRKPTTLNSLKSNKCIAMGMIVSDYSSDGQNELIVADCSNGYVRVNKNQIISKGNISKGSVIEYKTALQAQKTFPGTDLLFVSIATSNNQSHIVPISIGRLSFITRSIDVESSRQENGMRKSINTDLNIARALMAKVTLTYYLEGVITSYLKSFKNIQVKNLLQKAIENSAPPNSLSGMLFHSKVNITSFSLGQLKFLISNRVPQSHPMMQFLLNFIEIDIPLPSVTSKISFEKEWNLYLTKVISKPSAHDEAYLEDIFRAGYESGMRLLKDIGDINLISIAAPNNTSQVINHSNTKITFETLSRMFSSLLRRKERQSPAMQGQDIVSAKSRKDNFRTTLFGQDQYLNVTKLQTNILNQNSGQTLISSLGRLVRSSQPIIAAISTISYQESECIFTSLPFNDEEILTKVPAGSYVIQRKQYEIAISSGLRLMRLQVRAALNPLIALNDQYANTSYYDVVVLYLNESNVSVNLKSSYQDAFVSTESLLSLIQENSAILHNCQGISLGDNETIQSKISMIFQVDKAWLSLHEYTRKYGALFTKSSYELFQILRMNIIKAIDDLNKNGICDIFVTPDTIFIDISNLYVRILTLPFIRKISSNRSNDIMKCFLEDRISSNFSNADFPLNYIPMIANFDNVESWSVAVCIFYMAFGISYHATDATYSSLVGCDLNNLTNDHGDPEILRQSQVYMHILLTVLESRKQNGLRADSKFSFTQGLFPTVDNAEIIFGILEKAFNMSFERLKTFQERYRSRATSLGISIFNATLIWEQFIQNISSFEIVNNIPFENILKLLPSNFDQDNLHAFITTKIGMNISTLLFSAIISSLLPSELEEYTYQEKGTRALKILSSLMQEIKYYSEFQVLLHYFTLNLDSLVDKGVSNINFRKHRIFYQPNNVNQSKWKVSATNTTLNTVDGFIDEIFIVPLASILFKIFALNDYDRNTEEISNQYSDIEKFASMLLIFEELVAVWEMSIQTTKSSIDAFCPTLANNNVQIPWLQDNITFIVMKLMDSMFLEICLLFIHKYEQVEASSSQRYSDSNLVIDGLEGISVEGLSVSSQLNLRFNKLCNNSLAAVSRLKPVSYLSGENYGINYYISSEKLFESLLQTTTMIYLSAYCPLTYCGSFKNSKFPNIYKEFVRRMINASSAQLSRHIIAKISGISLSDDRIFKLNQNAEGLLFLFVGGEGKGSKSVLLSEYYLTKVDYAINESINTSLQYNHCRGSVYFNDMMKICRQMTTLESYKRGLKTGNMDKSIEYLIATIQSLFPSISSPVSEETECLQDIYPSSEMIQKIQVFFDLQLSSYILQYFEISDQIKFCILKLHLRAVSCYMKVCVSSRDQEPFSSLFLDLTNIRWLLVLETSLRVVLQSASQSFNNQANRLNVAIIALDIITLLIDRIQMIKDLNKTDIVFLISKISNISSTQYTKVRGMAKTIMKSFATKTPAISSIVAWGRSTAINSTNIENLHNEASDLRFGSTISEQDNFIDRLHEWLDCHLSMKKHEKSTASSKIDQLTSQKLSEIAQTLSYFISKICSSIFIMNPKEKSQKSKICYSGKVAVKQVQAVRLILVHLVKSEMQLSNTVISCLFSNYHSKQIDEGNPSKESQVNDAGLLDCLRLFAIRGMPSDDSWILLQIQREIVNLLNILTVSVTSINTSITNEVVRLFRDLGVSSVIADYIKFSLDVIESVQRLGYVALFSKCHRSVINSILTTWNIWIRLPFKHVHQEFIDCGIIDSLIGKWLLSSTYIPVSGNEYAGSKKSFYDPYVVKSIAILMLESIVSSDVYGEGRDLLMEEIISLIFRYDMLSKEIQKIQSGNDSVPSKSNTISNQSSGISRKEDRDKDRLSIRALIVFASMKEEKFTSKFLVRLYFLLIDLSSLTLIEIVEYVGIWSD